MHVMYRYIQLHCTGPYTTYRDAKSTVTKNCMIVYSTGRPDIKQHNAQIFAKTHRCFYYILKVGVGSIIVDVTASFIYQKLYISEQVARRWMRRPSTGFEDTTHSHL